MALNENKRASAKQNIPETTVDAEESCSRTKKIKVLQKQSVWFGTDIETDVPRETALAIFVNAIDAGFRQFDTAFSYHAYHAGKLDNIPDDVRVVRILEEAFEKTKVPRHELTVVYKVKLDDLAEAMQFVVKEWGLTVLMLHQVPDNLSKETAEKFRAAASLVGAAIGVSNVNHLLFDDVHSLLPFTFVENRFTPYTLQEWNVLQACKELGIRYLAYGWAGSRFKGSCDEKGGLPTELLSVLLDPGMAKVGGEAFRYQLCAWATKADHGIEPIVYTTNPTRMRQYLALPPLDGDFAEALTANAVCYEKSGRKRLETFGALGKVADAAGSPFFDRVLTFWCKKELGEYLERIAAEADSPNDLAHNLIRFCFDYQQANYEEGKPERWLLAATTMLHDWSKRHDVNQQSVVAFANKTPTEHAGSLDSYEKILEGKYRKAIESAVNNLTLIAERAPDEAKALRLNGLSKRWGEQSSVTAGTDDDTIYVVVPPDKQDEAIAAIQEIVGNVSKQ